MAITRAVRPQVIVTGVVVNTNPRRKYDDEAKRYTDEVVGYEGIVATESGGQVGVRYSSEFAPPRPLENIAIVVEIGESREYGAVFYFVRDLSDNDLDKIHSGLAVASK